MSDRTPTDPKRTDQGEDEEEALVEELEWTAKPMRLEDMTPEQLEAWALFERDLDVYIRGTEEAMAEHFAEYDKEQEEED